MVASAWASCRSAYSLAADCDRMACRAPLSGSFGDDGADPGLDGASRPRLRRILDSVSSGCGTEDVSDDMIPRCRVSADADTTGALGDQINTATDTTVADRQHMGNEKPQITSDRTFEILLGVSVWIRFLPIHRVRRRDA